MNAFPFHVDWDEPDGHHEESFAHKNEAVQTAHAIMDDPLATNVSTTYVDEEGHTYLVIEGSYE